MAIPTPSSSSWNLPRFSAEEMDAALSSFQARELLELSSSHLPLFEIPGEPGDDNPDLGFDLSDSRPDSKPDV